MQYNFGLIGFPLKHSLSKKFFTKKFESLNIKNFSYSLFSIPQIDILPELIKKHDLCGLNITSPYKNKIISYLDEVDEKIKNLNIVNLITIIKNNGKYLLKGYNTDIIGIEASLRNYLFPNKTKVLILGNGCTSASCQYYFDAKNIEYIIVCRNPNKKNEINYSELNKEIFNEVNIIINTTTLGMYPKIEDFPTISYQYIKENHICFDVIYNPRETKFLEKSKQFSKNTINGEKMFITQAEKSWDIWKNTLL